MTRILFQYQTGVINIVNIPKVRAILAGIVLIAMLIFLSVFAFIDCGKTIMGLINGDDYIFYSGGVFTVFLSIPVMIYGVIFFLCAILPQKEMTVAFLLRFIMPVVIYCCVAIVIGTIASIVVSIYPLGVNYYKCEHSGIMSGSHYARTKLICEQRKYSPTK